MKEVLSLDDIRKLDNYIPTLSEKESHILPYKIQFVKHRDLSYPPIVSPRTRAHTIKNAITAFLAAKVYHGSITARDRIIVSLADEESFVHIVNKYRKEIDTVFAPVNETHRDVLLKDRNIAIRKSLFRNKFRYKAHLMSSIDITELRDFMDFCAESLDNSFFEGSDASDWASNHEAHSDMIIYSILFNHKEEWLPLKMAYGDKIVQFQQVVLTSEVANFSKVDLYE